MMGYAVPPLHRTRSLLPCGALAPGRRWRGHSPTVLLLRLGWTSPGCLQARLEEETDAHAGDAADPWFDDEENTRGLRWDAGCGLWLHGSAVVVPADAEVKLLAAATAPGRRFSRRPSFVLRGAGLAASRPPTGCARGCAAPAAERATRGLTTEGSCRPLRAAGLGQRLHFYVPSCTTSLPRGIARGAARWRSR